MPVKKALIALIILLSVQAQAKTDSAQLIPQQDLEQEIFNRQAICGNNILCYFSQEEIAAALGPAAHIQGIEGSFKMDSAEADFSAEDLFDVNGNAFANAKGNMTDFSGRRKSAPRMSGGVAYKGISPIGAPIWPSFISKFKQCAQGCVPYIVSVHRPGAMSCHNGGRAIDVGGLVCGGQTHMAINRGRYESFVGCMKGKMKTLYRNGPGITAGHHDHAHFSNGCTVSGGRRWY